MSTPYRNSTTRRDPAEGVALVLRARRDLLLRTHRHRLRREDLEDCLSQAALELVTRAKAGASFASTAHLARVLEQRFQSRIADRRRAIEGRSAAQSSFEHALSAGAFAGAEEAVADPRSETEPLVLLREDLRTLLQRFDELSEDQQLVLSHQLMDVRCAEFCERFGWSREKYRKVAQRARSRLRTLIDPPEELAAPPLSSGLAGASPEVERVLSRSAPASRMSSQGPTYAQERSPHT